MNESMMENSFESSFSIERFNAELDNCVGELTVENDQLKFLIKDEDNYVTFNRLLKTHGIAFSINQSSVKRLGKLQFSNKNLGIPYFGHPFRVKKTAAYDCVNGPRRDKPKKNVSGDHPTVEKRRRNRSHNMRKIGCQASMSIKEIEYFPDYEVIGNTNIHDRKAACMKRLKEDLKSQQKHECPVNTKSLYFVSMSDPLTHSHPFSTSLRCQQVDKEVVQEIKRLVIQEGITDITFIKEVLQNFVRTHISTNISSEARAFFPSKRTIYNFILKFTNEAIGNHTDQIALRNKINDHCEITEQKIKIDPADDSEIVSDGESALEPILSTIDDWNGYSEEVVSSEMNTTVENSNSKTSKNATLVEFRKNLKVLQNISYDLPACVSQSDELEKASLLLSACQNILGSFLPADSNFIKMSNAQQNANDFSIRKRCKRE